MVAELDEDSDGTLERVQTTTYVNDARGNALETVSEGDQGAERIGGRSIHHHSDV